MSRNATTPVYENLTSLSKAARTLDVPYSSLYYRVLRGDLARYAVGPFVLVDIREAREVMKEGYKPRERVKA
jgi:hypothetical protein